MRLDLSKYRDITPLHRGAVVDAFVASTGPVHASQQVCLKFFRPERIGVSSALDARFESVVRASMHHTATEILCPIDFGSTSEGYAYVVPISRGISLRRVRDLFVAHGEHMPVDLAVYLMDEVLRILCVHAEARREASAVQAETHGSVTLSAIRLDAAGRTFLTEPGMWAVFGSEERERRVAAGAEVYAPPEHQPGSLALPSADVYAVGVCLRSLLACVDRNEISRELESFAFLATDDDPQRRFETPLIALYALREAHVLRPSVQSMRAWLGERAAEHNPQVLPNVPSTARASADAMRAHERDARERADVGFDARVEREQKRDVRSAAPLRAPRSLASDKDRVVVQQTGSLWAIFVVCVMIGFIGSMAYSFWKMS